MSVRESVILNESSWLELELRSSFRAAARGLPILQDCGRVGGRKEDRNRMLLRGQMPPLRLIKPAGKVSRVI